MPLFYHCLNPGGLLFLGSAETIGAFTHLFAPLDARLRLYRRTNTGQAAEIDDFPAVFSSHLPIIEHAGAAKPSAALPVPNLQALVDQQLLHDAPPAVLVNEQGDILYISGHTGNFLEPAAGKANWNIFVMARENLRYALNGVFQQARRDKKVVTRKNLLYEIAGRQHAIDLSVRPLDARGLLLVVFRAVEAPALAQPAGDDQQNPANAARLALLEQETLQLHAELQTTREEMQTSQEELKSSNEELQSTNEEMQSTNEELTTSKEEMQSLNEELQTVNHELQARNEDLARSNNDMKNLLNSTDIATLFLDDNLRVRRFTSQAAQIIRLLPGDAGRPVTDITSDLLYPEMTEDARSVLRTLVFKERPVSTRDGRWFSVRVMPYRTLENRIDGVVITFTNISASKKLELSLRETDRELRALFEYLPVPFALFEVDSRLADCRFVFANSAFERSMGVKNDFAQGLALREAWPAIHTHGITAFNQAAGSGAPQHFVIYSAPDGKPYAATVYRPGETSPRVCVILAETSMDASPAQPRLGQEKTA
jgi:two-component system, chemotaxis family, CheB/CheR fusion protein